MGWITAAFKPAGNATRIRCPGRSRGPTGLVNVQSLQHHQESIGKLEIIAMRKTFRYALTVVAATVSLSFHEVEAKFGNQSKKTSDSSLELAPPAAPKQTSAPAAEKL
jgi:hypothetical protein